MNELQLLLFVMTSLLVILTPGQDMILVMSRGMSQGIKAGMITAMGVSVGLLVHTMLAAMGVGALLLASETLFTLVKMIGATYLIYLGIRLLVSKSVIGNLKATKKSYKKMFSEGAISNITNPKVT
ncbi:MAG: LysE family translocator, partial [Gammaproteobacteria bacterium]|nr:LysE family translocator [Gammaproteobacteria bacterium]